MAPDYRMLDFRFFAVLVFAPAKLDDGCGYAASLSICRPSSFLARLMMLTFTTVS